MSVEDDLENYIKKLNSNSHYIEFISILNQKCVAVTTRGYTSTNILIESGYQGEIYTTGCPSQTISPNPNLGEEIKRNINTLKRNQVPLKVVHNLARFYDKKLNKVDVHISKITENIPNIKVQQSGSNVIFERLSGSIFEEFYFASRHNNPSDPEIKQKADYLFTNCESWSTVVSKFTLSIGTRLHGNQMPFQLGIPSLTIAHDMRVLEACQQMGVPYVDEKTLLSFESIWDAVEKIDSIFVPQQFDQVRSSNCRKIRMAILKAGLTPSEKLNNLSSI